MAAKSYLLSVGSASLDFGFRVEDDPSLPEALKLTLRNDGNQNVTIQSAPPVEHFTVRAEPVLPVTLQPGQSIEWTVQPVAGLPLGDYSDVIRFASSAGSTCEATASFAVKTAYGERTLTDQATGISISGQAIHQYAVLAVDPIALHNEGTCPACDVIRKRIQKDSALIFLTKNIDLSHGFSGTLTVTIPGGMINDGQKLSVLHCASGKLVTINKAVKNGSVTFTTVTLSPFAIFQAKTFWQSPPVYFWIGLGILAAAAITAGSLLAVQKLKKAKKATH